MRYGCPDGHPADELRIQISDMLLQGDVVDRVVEQRDKSGDTNNGYGLCGADAKDHGGQR